VTDAGLEELKELKQLWRLDLSNTLVTGTGLKEFQELQQFTELDLSSVSSAFEWGHFRGLARGQARPPDRGIWICGIVEARLRGQNKASRRQALP